MKILTKNRSTLFRDVHIKKLKVTKNSAHYLFTTHHTKKHIDTFTVITIVGNSYQYIYKAT